MNKGPGNGPFYYTSVGYFPIAPLQTPPPIAFRFVLYH